MGLDMYLTRKAYICQECLTGKPATRTTRVKTIVGSTTNTDTDTTNEKVEYVEKEILDKSGEKLLELIANREKGEKYSRHQVAISNEVGYWRKFNALHNYMVNEFGGGVDECQPIELDIEQIIQIRDLMEKVARKAKVDEGWVCNGDSWRGVKADDEYTLLSGEKKLAKDLKVGDEVELHPNDPWTDHSKSYMGRITEHYVEQEKVRMGYKNFYWGETITNAEEMAKLLPTTCGCFFGSTDYDENYLEDVNDTIDILDQVIEEHKELIKSGVDEYDIYYEYRASW